LLYGLLLFGVLGANGVNQVAIKHLGQTGSTGHNLMAEYKCVYFGLMYSGLAGFLLVDLVVTRRLKATSRFVFIAGPLAAIGSVIGMSLMGTLVQYLPAAVLFTTNAITSILVAALVSALFLGERTRAAWYLTVALSILTILLVNLGTLR